MPSNVAAAAPVTVLPLSLSRGFNRAQEWQCEVIEYSNGETERKTSVTNSRKSWQLGKRRPPSEIVTLHNFFIARKGGVEAFYFYDGTETSPLWSWDATGVITTGRYTVVFEGAWKYDAGSGLVAADIKLREVA